MATGDPWCPTHGFAPCRCHELGLNKMNGNFTVLTPEQEERLRKLEAFYAEIRRLAVTAELSGITPVYWALSAVDPQWNKG